jgi:hypothetical protein
MPVYENEQGYIDTWGIGGDRFSFLPQSMFTPAPFVGTTSPTTLGLLSIPPTYNQLQIANQQAYGGGSLASQQGAAAPFDPRKSLVPWVVVGLLLGVWGIHQMYYKGRHR